LVSIINNTFGITAVPDEYNTDFIYFEEGFSFDNSGVNDLDVIMKVCDAVGRDNVLIKLHPRNRVNRFESKGIKTNSAVGIPWEVIHLNRCFEDKVFVAISCGSVLSSKILYAEHVKTILLYKCTNKNPPLVNEEYEKYISLLAQKYGADIIVPDTMDEAIALLKQIKDTKMKA
jgi:hypothetical protein